VVEAKRRQQTHFWAFWAWKSHLLVMFQETYYLASVSGYGWWLGRFSPPNPLGCRACVSCQFCSGCRSKLPPTLCNLHYFNTTFLLMFTWQSAPLTKLPSYFIYFSSIFHSTKLTKLPLERKRSAKGGTWVQKWRKLDPKSGVGKLHSILILDLGG